MKALLIIQTKTGFLLVEPSTIPEVKLEEVQAFDSISGRYSSGGVIDAVREHFNPPQAELEAAR